MTQLPDTSTEQGQREASVMLARLCGWTNRIDGNNGIRYWVNDVHGKYLWYGEKPYPNLYKPENMALAWRVLNWAWVSPIAVSLVDWAGIQPGLIFAICPTEAQRAWLDKILLLADEAGMLEVK